MRVRIIKPLVSALGSFNAGSVADVPDNIGMTWCKVGISMRDKSLDGATETKSKSKKRVKR